MTGSGGHLALPSKLLYCLLIFQKESSKIKQNCYYHQLSINMLFSHRVIKMAWAHRAQPPFHKEGALAHKALEEGGDGHGMKPKYCGYDGHVSQLFIFIHAGARSVTVRGEALTRRPPRMPCPPPRTTTVGLPCPVSASSLPDDLSSSSTSHQHA